MAVCLRERERKREKPGPAFAFVVTCASLSAPAGLRVHGDRREPEDPSIFSILPAAAVQYPTSAYKKGIEQLDMVRTPNCFPLPSAVLLNSANHSRC